MYNNDLTDKVSGFTETTYSAVTGLAYDSTNKKLGLKVGADTVIPFSGGGAKLVGTYSSNATVDVSAYGATSASQFLAVITSSSGSSASGYTQGIPSNGYYTISSSVTMPSLTLNGNSLAVNVGYNTFSVSGVVNRTDSVNNAVKVYYVGDIE